MDRLDKYLLKIITLVVVYWVKKYKYKKHKWDFFIMVTEVEATYWIASLVIQAYYYSVRSPKFRIGIWILYSLMSCIVMAMQMAKVRSIQIIKKDYDWLWERRKHPVVYNSIKEVSEMLFETQKRFRMVHVSFIVVILLFSIPFNTVMVPIWVGFLLEAYKDYIFELDEPENKEKKQKDSITEIAMRAWKNLTLGLSPASVGSGE